MARASSIALKTLQRGGFHHPCLDAGRRDCNRFIGAAQCGVVVAPEQRDLNLSQPGREIIGAQLDGGVEFLARLFIFAAGKVSAPKIEAGHEIVRLRSYHRLQLGHSGVDIAFVEHECCPEAARFGIFRSRS